MNDRGRLARNLAVSLLAVLSTVGGHAPAAVGTWRIQVSPDVTQPTGELASVSCVNAASCMAVGSYISTAGLFVTLAEKWNGTSWRRQPTPNPAGGSNFQLTGVSCPSARFCDAVGSYLIRGGVARVGMAEKWDGRHWTALQLPMPAGSRDVEPAAVSCSTATFCEAVGLYQNGSGNQVPLAELWNGKSWRLQSAPGQAGFSLSGVSCLSAKFCEATGEGSPSGQDALRWDGKAWSAQTTPAPASAVGMSLSGVSCVATDRCEAAGAWLAPGGEGPQAFTLAEAWNGKTWAIQATPRPRAMPNSGLAGVSCTSARSCEAVGSNFDPVNGTSATLAERWDGTSWRIRPTPGTAGSNFLKLSSVSCAGPGACEAVGLTQQAAEQALAEAWNGRSWRIQRGVAPGGAANNFLNAVSCVTAGFCEAVGQAMDSSGSNIPLAEVRRHGTTWKIQHTPEPAKLSNIRGWLNGVSCTSVQFCVAVGQSNSIPDLFTELWNGTSWKIRTAPGSGALTSVSCPSKRFCAAVGATISVPRDRAETDMWNGTSWSAVPPAPGFSALNSVSCTSARFCEAVGATSSGAGVQVWNGSSWSVQPIALPAGVTAQAVDLNGVSCTAPDACEAVGDYAPRTLQSATLAEAWDGTDWDIQHTPSPMPGIGPTLSAVWCISAASCTAVGLIGLVSTSPNKLTLAEIWDGQSWRLQATPTPHPAIGGGGLAGVWCGPSLGCTAVGFAVDAGQTPATLVEVRR